MSPHTPDRARAGSTWFAVETLGRAPGYIVASNGRTWGFCRVRVVYSRGGEETAVVPLWLAGRLRMRGATKNAQGEPVSLAASAWHRFWKRGQREGWIAIEQLTTAADLRAA